VRTIREQGIKFSTGSGESPIHGAQSVLPSFALLSVSLVPLILRHANPALAAGSFLLSLAFLYFAGKLALCDRTGPLAAYFSRRSSIFPWFSRLKRLYEVEARPPLELEGTKCAPLRARSPALASPMLPLPHAMGRAAKTTLKIHSGLSLAKRRGHAFGNQEVYALLPDAKAWHLTYQERSPFRVAGLK